MCSCRTGGTAAGTSRNFPDAHTPEQSFNAPMRTPGIALIAACLVLMASAYGGNGWGVSGASASTTPAAPAH